MFSANAGLQSGTPNYLNHSYLDRVDNSNYVNV